MRSNPVTTDGWRGMPGPDWSEATVAGILVSLVESGQVGTNPAIAFDGRGGSRELALLACDLLAEFGLSPLLGSEPTPTPALGRFVRDTPEVTSGITFTASHNPAGYIGMKVRDTEGLSIDIPPPGPATAGLPQLHPEPARAGLNAHYAATVGRDLRAALSGFSGEVIIDAAHGALGAVADLLPGTTWSRSRTLPFFCGVTPDPVTPENIDPVRHAALRGSAHPERLLMAFSDGDGDRLVLATAKSGYISSSEQAAIACRAGLPAAVVIATAVTPRMVRHVADSRQLGWLEVPVGFKFVVTAWRQHGRPAALGLEPNGALAYATDQDGYFERDALSTLTLITQLHRSVPAIDRAVAELRHDYPHKLDMITSPMTAHLVLQWLSGLLTGWEAEQSGQLASFTQGAWRVLVRPSGTEKATRIYTEAPDDVTASIRNSLRHSAEVAAAGTAGTQE